MRFCNIFSNYDDYYSDYLSYDNGVRDKVDGELLRSRTIIISHEINQNDSATVVGLLLLLDSTNQKDITLLINSPGGGIEGLMAIYDTMQMIRSNIRTVCMGDASSAAAIILAAGTKGMRYASQNSQVMIHQMQVSGGSGGSTTDIEIEARASKVLKRRLTDILARHTGQTYQKVYKDCERDKYMFADEALEYGIIDEIIEPIKKIPKLKTTSSSVKKKFSKKKVSRKKKVRKKQ